MATRQNMGTELVTLDPATFAKRMLDSLTGGLTRAAKIYREYIDRNGDLEALHACIPQWTNRQWRVLEALAFDRVLPEVTLLPEREKSALMLLPIAQQRRIMDNGVELLVLEPETSITVKALNELSPLQRAQVFGPNGVRTVAEQRVWLEAERQRIHLTAELDIPDVTPPSYRIYKDTVLCTKGARFTRKDLLRILSELEG